MEEIKTYKVFFYGCMSLSLIKKLTGKNPLRYSKAILKDHRLRFCDYSDHWMGATATLVRNKGSIVEGLFVVLDEEQIKKIDQYEHNYSRQRRIITNTESGERITAFVYVKKDCKLDGIPSRKYVNAMRRLQEDISQPFYSVSSGGSSSSSLEGGSKSIGFSK